jgi:hypothetical protein
MSLEGVVLNANERPGMSRVPSSCEHLHVVRLEQEVRHGVAPEETNVTVGSDGALVETPVFGVPIS